MQLKFLLLNFKNKRKIDVKKSIVLNCFINLILCQHEFFIL